MTVVYVISHMNMGGAQRQIAYMARGLDPDHWRPVLICFGEEAPLMEELRRDGVEVIRLERRGRFDAGLLIRLAREYRRLGARIVHTHLRTANLWGRVAAFLAGVPHVVVSELSVAYRTGRTVRSASRLLGRRTDAVMTNSRAGVPYAADHHDHLPTRVEIVPNGIVLPSDDAKSREAARATLRQLGGFEPNSRIVASVANLLPEKRVEDAVAIAAKLRERRPELRWIVFGEGAERGRLERRIAESGLGEIFVLAGLRPDASALLSGADGLLHPSGREGLPNAVLEGMAAGLPAIVTDSGGTGEAIEHNVTGVLLEPGDVDGMAGAIDRLMPPSEAGREMGRRARRLVESRYSVRAMIRATEDCYRRRCLDRAKSPRVVMLISRHSRRSTFIAREMGALRAEGVDLAGFSLLPPEDEEGRRGARLGLEDGVGYLPFVPPPDDLLAAALITIGRPVRTAGVLTRVVLGQLRSPRVLIRCLGVMPKAIVLAARARRLRAGALHAHWATVSATAGMVAARIAGIPFSFTGHAWDLVFDTDLLGEKMREARFVVVCNHFSRDQLAARYPDHARKVRVVYHGLDLQRFPFRDPAPANGPQKVLAVGRLVEKKGFDTLVRACGLLGKRGIPVECDIVGEGGPERESLERLIADEAPGTVRIGGYAPPGEMPRMMGGYDVLAAPSVVQSDGAMDGIPNVIIEAMALGLPVVTTGVAGIPEVARAGETALVVPERDADALATAIEQIRSEPDLAPALARASRALMESRFDLGRSARRLSQLFGGEDPGEGDREPEVSQHGRKEPDL